MKLRWTDDPQAESQLAALGLSWTRLTVHIGEIAIKESLQNNARLDKPLCEDTAFEYACAMEAGAKFPAVVLRPNGSKLYRVLSGNHRVAGVEVLVEGGSLDRDSAVFENAYIISSDDPMILELVVRSANRWQGRRQNSAEAFEHARWMMKKYNMDIAELSKHFFLSVKALRDRFRADDIRANLKASNVSTSRLTDSQITKIGQLGFNQRLEQRAACVAEEYGLKTNEVRDLVDKARRAAQDGEQAGVAAIKEMESTYRAAKVKAPEGTAAARRPIRARFMTHLVGFHNFLRCGNRGQEFPNLDGLQVAGKHDRHEVHEIWKQLKRKMDTLLHDSQSQDRKAG
jgi:hypothetical protein